MAPRAAHRLLATTAAGLLLALTPATQALEIGDLVADSRLGQPLSARVAVSLAAGESLGPGCVTVTGAAPGLPALAGLRASVEPALGPATASIRLDSPRPLTEPAYGLTVRVACPGVTASLREFVFIPDLPGAGPVPAPMANAAASSAGLPHAQDDTGSPAPPEPLGDGAAPVARPGRALTPLTPGDRHLVQTGETLWSIAVRATATGGSPRLTAAAIHAANPQAFLAGDPARLMAGSTLLIPAETVAAPAADPQASLAAAVPASAEAPTDGGERPATAAAATTTPAGPTDAAVTENGDIGATGNPGDDAGEAATVDAAAGALAPTLAATAVGAPEAAAAPAPAPRPRPARQPAAAAPARPPQPSAADPLVSALAGAGFGLLASSPFWWRSRRRSRAVAEPAAQPEPVKVAMPVAAAAEPAIAVSFEPLPAGEQALAGPGGAGSGTWRQQGGETTRSQRLRAADDITSELEELFNTAPGEATGDTTARRPWAPGTGMIDLPALAEGSDTDEHQAQGLRDALALLERDYEQEWTGSRTRPAATDPPSPEATPTAPIRRLG